MSTAAQHTAIGVTANRAEEVACGLRELADWLEARPGMPVMYAIAQADYIHGEVARERFLELAAQFDKFIPGRRGRGDYQLLRRFAGGVEFGLTCEEKVLAPEPLPSPWPMEVKALAPDADWGDAS